MQNMSHNIQAYRCGPDVVKIIARPSHNYITALSNSLDEREKENKRTSLSRSRRTVADILHCNYFRFFLTVTIESNENGSSPTRDDVVQICKNGLRTIKRHYGGPVGYIIVPELSDEDEMNPGRWHGHIMLTDIPSDMLQPYSSSDKGLPAIIYRRMAVGIDCFSTPVFARYGYCLVERVGDTKADYDALAKYLTKTMYLDSCAPLPKGQRRIISSHGLARPERVFSGVISSDEYATIRASSGESLRDGGRLIHYVSRSALSFL